VRVNPDNSLNLISSLSGLQQQENELLAQMASGRRLAKPSDDPAAAGSLVDVISQSAQVDTFTQNSSSLNSAMQLADSTLASVVTALQRAATLGINAANGTLSDSDRAAVVQELEGIRDQVLSLSNTSSQGTFLFAGTASVDKPFVLDPASPAGVTYLGNTETNLLEISNGYHIQTGVPGNDLFLNPSGSVFKTLTDLINAVQSNSGIGEGSTAVSQARALLSAQRVFYGNAMNQLNANTTVLQNESTQLSNRENSLAAADLAKVTTQLVSLQTGMNAVLSAASKTMGTSLFDYLNF